jgi:uncharacterized membrane-anchored protein
MTITAQTLFVQEKGKLLKFGSGFLQIGFHSRWNAIATLMRPQCSACQVIVTVILCSAIELQHIIMQKYYFETDEKIEKLGSVLAWPSLSRIVDTHIISMSLNTHALSYKPFQFSVAQVALVDV